MVFLSMPFIHVLNEKKEEEKSRKMKKWKKFPRKRLKKEVETGKNLKKISKRVVNTDHWHVCCRIIYSFPIV